MYLDQIVLLRLRAFLKATRKGRDGITLYFVLWIEIRQVSWLANIGVEVVRWPTGLAGAWRSSE